MNIVLTGFMASGKTEISKEISKNSDYKLVDTDDMIVEEAGKSINEIFADDGEAEFRRIEHETIKKAAEMDNCVISTGGGVPLNKENMIHLRKNGVIVNLAPGFDVIEARLKKAAETRPLLKDQSIEDVKKRFDDRKPFYEDCDIKIEVTNERTPVSYALEILSVCEDKFK